MPDIAPPIPSPPVNPETAAFWQAAQEQRLLVAHCSACGAFHHYPRTLCPHCFSASVNLVDAAGSGHIYSVSVMRRGTPQPFAIAYVILDEGVTLLTNIVDTDLDALRIGQRVRVVFRESENGQRVPMFTPAA
jgi:uncharacterized OB-fold protein